MTDPNDPIAPGAGGDNRPHDGLTKREYFAAQVMAGFAACPAESLVDCYPKPNAELAVEWADELVKALNAGAK
jgi:hypothetical protein